jgi:hypothetical protein
MVHIKIISSSCFQVLLPVEVSHVGIFICAELCDQYWEQGTRIALPGANESWIHVLNSCSASLANTNFVLNRENAGAGKTTLALLTEFGRHEARAFHQQSWLRFWSHFGWTWKQLCILQSLPRLGSIYLKHSWPDCYEVIRLCRVIHVLIVV